jgi:hypothetical protein
MVSLQSIITQSNHLLSCNKMTVLQERKLLLLHVSKQLKLSQTQDTGEPQAQYIVVASIHKHIRYRCKRHY